MPRRLSFDIRPTSRSAQTLDQHGFQHRTLNGVASILKHSLDSRIIGNVSDIAKFDFNFSLLRFQTLQFFQF